ncbi:hypothetical protein G6F56_005752 [Rhizopus delemar]|uniref:Uncharacterized protein n=1 Tax=Rhizopus stolonifer TaxID=4846 RepID=A0A367KLG7_RHIST|nr:hypothetical protein G6F56_005752 [Rhizopus delemar]RCI03009.1 hypothetical protein CU098_010337 [Rhizopus stolonifer]
MEGSLASNRSYRLYMGHGNWINLGEKITNELLEIFAKGDPARHQLAPGLFIDIIPHDVDFNSANIDMRGLMRADLVYEPTQEKSTQQNMSIFVRDLLNEQNIVDAFPPTKPDEELPKITSLPSHRHLSLIPSVSNSTRRKNKLGHTSSSSSILSKSKKKSYPPCQIKNQKARKSELVLPLIESTCMNPIMYDNHHQLPNILWSLPTTSYASFRINETNFNFHNSPVATSIVSASDTAHTSSSASSHIMEFENQLPSPYQLLNGYGQELSSFEEPAMSFYNLHSSTSSLTAVTPLPFNCFSENHQNFEKDDSLSTEDGRTNTRPSILAHSEPITMKSHLKRQQCSMDTDSYSSSSPGLNEISTLPNDMDNSLHENFKYILL